MDYCLPLGIPHSEFLRWSDEDRRKALEWQADKKDHCGSCGQRRSDWLDENGKELMDPPFEVTEYLCPGCQELELYTEEKREKRKGVHYAFRRFRPDTEESDDLAE